MVKIVIAGVSTCPNFAKVEALADQLTFSLQNFKVHKIVKLQDEWQDWLRVQCEKYGWRHKSSPIVWRELINRGGKGLLIGGHNEFQEYAFAHYNISIQLTTDELKAIAAENDAVAIEVRNEKNIELDNFQPLKICISNASSELCYGLIGHLASNESPKSGIILHLLDAQDNLEAVRGVAMEAADSASGALYDVVVTSEPNTAFNGCALIIISANEVSQAPSEPKQDFYVRVHDHYAKYVPVIESAASAEVVVVVVSAERSPVNFIVHSMLSASTKLSYQQIVGSSDVVKYRAMGVMARHLKVNVAGIQNVIVWGNVGGTSVIDTHKGQVSELNGAIWGPPPYSRSLDELIHDDKWMKTKFLRNLAQQQKKYNDLRNKGVKRYLLNSSAAFNTLKFLLHGYSCGRPELQSLAIASQGWYGIPNGVVFSVPVKLSPTEGWTIVEDLEPPIHVKRQFSAIIQELQNEQAQVLKQKA